MINDLEHGPFPEPRKQRIRYNTASKLQKARTD